MASRRRGSTRPLQPGEHSIDVVSSRVAPNGHVWIDWCYRPLDGSKTRQVRSKGPTAGIARDRALQHYRRLIAGQNQSSWKPTDRLADYITQVCSPAMEAAALAPRSKVSYRTMMKLLVGDCDRHTHRESLKDHTILSGTRFRVLEQCLVEIASLHGAPAAQCARSVLGRYVLDQLIRDDLLEASPIAGKHLTMPDTTPATSHRGGVALSCDQWNAVMNHLLTLDPTSGITSPKAGPYTLEDRIALRRNVIDVTLLQAVTGMRIGEATALTWAMVESTPTHVICHLTSEMTKTKRGRDVAIVDPLVGDHLLARRRNAPDSWPVIGAPTQPDHRWNRTQYSTAIAAFYTELARDLDIPELITQRSHVWRATINTLTMTAGVPEVIRAAALGHTAQINRTHYTDTSHLTVMGETLATLRTP